MSLNFNAPNCFKFCKVPPTALPILPIGPGKVPKTSAKLSAPVLADLIASSVSLICC